MKTALETCLLALNPNSPQPTAGMVKIDRGAMWAYGGTFCVRVPVSVDIGAAFNPKAVLPFFRKDRKNFSATVAKGKLTLKDGKETLTTRCLPPDEMVVLDTLGMPAPCDLDMDALKLCASIVDPSIARLCAQGVQFRWGAVEATDNKRLVAAASGIPEDLPPFNLPVESAKTLLRMKGPVVGVSVDQSVVKFTLKNSMSLASNLICEELIDMSSLFGHDDDWTPLDVPETVLRDVLAVDCTFITVSAGQIGYRTLDDRSEVLAEGTITTIKDKDVAFKIRREFLATAVAMSYDLRINRNSSLIQAFGETGRSIVGLTQ